MAIEFTKKALKGLRKVPARHADAILSGLKRIGDGDSAGLDIRLLRGLNDTYRLRIGGYRAIYQRREEKVDVDGEIEKIIILTILVLRVGPRGDVYK